MDLFLVPVLIHQLASQPIEQLGMTWVRALGSEIVVGLDQAAAEIGLPDPIDDHPRGERVAAIHQPPRQIQPIGRCARTGIPERGQDVRHARRDEIALAREVASLVNVRDPRAAAALFHNHGRDELGLSSAQLLESLILGPETWLMSQHQLDQSTPRGCRSLFARLVERHPNVGLLGLCEFELERLFPAPFTIVEIGILLRQGAVKPVDLARI